MANTAQTASDSPSLYQQEVDVLRGQIGQLGVTGLWTSKDPPKLAGIYGVLLQGLEAGESLIRAFVRLHETAEATRTNEYKILTLVKAYDKKYGPKPKKKSG